MTEPDPSILPHKRLTAAECLDWWQPRDQRLKQWEQRGSRFHELLCSYVIVSSKKRWMNSARMSSSC